MADIRNCITLVGFPMKLLEAIETPDDKWYSKQSAAKRLPAHCPLAIIDKCPRYYLSLKLIDSVLPGSLTCEDEKRQSLEDKWKFSNAFANDDLSSEICLTESGELKGVDGFCPEVTAVYLGLYCSSLNKFVDDDHRTSAQAILTDAGISKRDPRYLWGLVFPLHYYNCREFAVYSPPSPKTSRTPKQSNGKISPQLRWRVFERDNFTCQYCGARGGDGTPLEVDHRTSLADGGTNEVDNLVTACTVCNSGKGPRSVEL